MSNADQSQRFLFEDTEVRGEIVGLSKSYQKMISAHNYPEPVAKLLGEFMSAAVLLASTIKFDGSLILQCKGTGLVSTVMVEVVNRTQIRGIAHYADNFDVSYEEDKELLGEGQLVITIAPENSKGYQGIVVVKNDDLAGTLEDYFLQSEQIRSRIWLECDGKNAAGMLIQAMPRSAHESSLVERKDDETWDHLIALANTTKAEELMYLANEELLHRLYHEEKIGVFESRDLEFKCSCSRHRIGGALLSVGIDECREIIKEQSKISIDCDFCNQHYSFNAQEVEDLFETNKKTVH